MTEEKKPARFWHLSGDANLYEPGHNYRASVHPKYGTDFKVIEYSAYTALEAELDAAKEEILKLRQEIEDADLRPDE
jgi:hypothetical protein